MTKVHGYESFVIAAKCNETGDLLLGRKCLTTKTAWSGFLNKSFEYYENKKIFEKYNRTFSNVAFRLCALELKTALLQENEPEGYELSPAYKMILRLEYAMISIGVFEGIGVLQHVKNMAELGKLDKLYIKKGTYLSGLKNLSPNFTSKSRLEKEINSIRDRIHVDQSFERDTDFSEITEEKLLKMQTLTHELLLALERNSATIPSSTNLLLNSGEEFVIEDQ